MGFRRDLTQFQTNIFAAAKIFRKFRSEIRLESRTISRTAACRRSAQMSGTSKGRGKAARHRAARISARSRAISNAKFCGREIFFGKFGLKFVDNCIESHAAQYVSTQHSVWGPLRVVAGLQHMEHSGFRRDFEPRMLRPHKFFENFGPKSAENRTKSHAPRPFVGS